MKKIFLYILLLPTILFGQDYLSRQLEYADNLFSSKLYYDAITEYKRLQFFDTEKKYSDEIKYKIGMCYKNGAKFADAIKYFSLAEKEAVKPEDVFEIKTQIIRTNILRRTTDRAHQLLDDLEKDYRFADKTKNIDYWRGWTYMFADDWENAANSFAKADSTSQLKTLAEQTDDEKYSLTFAKFSSYILPGCGQIYTGNYLSGFLSLGWNVLWGYLTFDAFNSNRLFDGFAIGSLLWMRFYRGNVQNTEKFVREKNLIIANKTLRYIQNNYEGLKP